MTDSVCEIPIAEQDPKTGRFLPGNSGFTGRPKGARNKLGEDFIQSMYEDFTEHGKVAIQTVREDRPQDYIKVIASLLPKDINLSLTASETFTRMIELMDQMEERGELARLEFSAPESQSVRN